MVLFSAEKQDCIGSSDPWCAQLIQFTRKPQSTLTKKAKIKGTISIHQDTKMLWTKLLEMHVQRKASNRTDNTTYASRKSITFLDIVENNKVVRCGLGVKECVLEWLMIPSVRMFLLDSVIFTHLFRELSRWQLMLPNHYSILAWNTNVTLSSSKTSLRN